jgi:hypothetical protein
MTFAIVFGMGWTARMVVDAEIIRFERQKAGRAIVAAWKRSSLPTATACARSASVKMRALEALR